MKIGGKLESFCCLFHMTEKNQDIPRFLKTEFLYLGKEQIRNPELENLEVVT